MSEDKHPKMVWFSTELWYGFQLVYTRVLGQKRDSKNKIYSFHAPEVSCISKGKDHKKYEFGNKSGFVITKKSGIIIGAMAFEDNLYDGHTLEPQLDQVSDLMGRLPKVALVDRGYKERKTILGVEIMMPGTGKGKTAYEKIRDRARFRRRAAVEPVIGHLKSDYRMLRNYLKGVEGDMINTIMAAVAFNMMKRLRQIRDAIYFVLDLLTGNWSIKYTTVRNY